MGVFISSVPGKNPDGVTIQTNAQGLLYSSMVAISNTPVAIDQTSLTQLVEISLPTLLNTDIITLYALWSGNTLTTPQLNARLFDGTTERNMGNLDVPTTNRIMALSKFEFVSNGTSTGGNSQQTSTSTFNVLTPFAGALSAQTKLRIYGKRGAGTMTLEGYRVVINR